MEQRRAEEKREIREAIRRKILERRSKEDGSVPAFEEPLAQSQEHLSEDSRTFKGMESSAADAATALGIINMFLISGGGLLGIGVFEKGINIKRRCSKD